MIRQTVTPYLELDTEQAWALAQFLKRLGHDDYRIKAQDDQQAQRIQLACSELRRALAEAGYDPR